ncbi:MAG: thioesterase family protein [Alphaproteobacteria bacterium]
MATRRAKARGITLRRTVSWSESDPAGMMNSPRAFDYAIDAIELVYRQALGITFLGLIERHALGAPLVHLSCDYTAPLAEGDRLTLTAWIERLGTSSITWRVEARRSDRKVAFTVRLVSSFVRRRDFKPVAMPARFRARFGRYLRADSERTRPAARRTRRVKTRK